MRPAAIDLFVYGTLMAEANVYALTGRHFRRVPAVLQDYEKIVPNVGYPYVLPKPGSSVDGLLLERIDPRSLAALDEYEDEGRLYRREEVSVVANGRRLRCATYVGNLEVLREHFGEDVALDARVRQFIEEKIRDLLAASGDEGELMARARRELLGGAIEELVQLHFTFPALFPHQAKKLLRPSELPSLAAVRAVPEALPYAGHYLDLAVRHILFDVVEERVFSEFSGSVEVPRTFFQHTISVLASLAFLNRHRAPVKEMMERLGCKALRPDWDYVDYAAQAIKIADALYHRREIAEIIAWINGNRQVGVTPMGAELEFSNLGAAAVYDRGGSDPQFDGFYYFADFDLHRRCWKLGGHVDDHREGRAPRERTRGFFEYAFGRLQFLTDLSRPVTQDPWVLSQLINQATMFLDIRPHSLHLTFQPRDPIRLSGKNSISHLIALLLLGGDLQLRSSGYFEARVGDGEIIDPQGRLYLFEENRHEAERPVDEFAENAAVPVIEFKFPRLRAAWDYQPLIVALKGFHWAVNPRPFASCAHSLPLAEIEAEKNALVQWARHPHPLATRDLEDFVRTVAAGLQREAEAGGHTPEYRTELLGEILEDLAGAERLVVRVRIVPAIQRRDLNVELRRNSREFSRFDASS